MENLALALDAFGGGMYVHSTGCGLNTCNIDMDFLVEATNDTYVLAGRISQVDTNVATVSSGIGSMLSTVVDAMQGSSNSNISELISTDQGCGKAGRNVAKEMVCFGAKHVQTCDLFPQAAEIKGCTHIQDWANTSCDFLVPGAKSLSITEGVASKTFLKLSSFVSAPIMVHSPMRRPIEYLIRGVSCIFRRVLVRLALFWRIVLRYVSSTE